jgi:hypothetical protein
MPQNTGITPKLHQTSMKVAHWKIPMSGKRNKIDYSKKLSDLLLQIEWEENQPTATTVNDITAKLREAQKEI